MTLTAASAPAGQTYSYKWSTGATSQSIVVAIEGSYTVTVTLGDCTSTCSIPVTTSSIGGPRVKIFGYVFVEGTSTPIPGSIVSCYIKVNGVWIGAGSMTVGADGYFNFEYLQLIQGFRLVETNMPDWVSTSAKVRPGGTVIDVDNMEHLNAGEGTHGPYIFYDIQYGTNPDCGCTNRVVFHTDRDGNWELYSLTPGSTIPVNLTSNAAADIDPAVAPNGAVSFQSNRDNNWNIYTVSQSGARFVTRQVTSNIADDINPAWSLVCLNPRLAFQSNRDGHWELYVTSGALNARAPRDQQQRRQHQPVLVRLTVRRWSSSRTVTASGSCTSSMSIPVSSAA